MILDEIEIKENQEYESYLKLVHYWGYAILLGGITSAIAVIFVYTKIFTSISSILSWNVKYFSLIPLSIMPFAAIIAGWTLIQSQKNPNLQSKGLFWLKLFWAMALLTLIIFFITN